MKRPWQFWMLFSLALLLVAAAMTWLTYKGLQLDRAEAVARRQAELEEDVSRALWRMEVTLIPILAKEAARPALAYRPFLGSADASAAPPQLSPLLSEPSDYVLVNFQVNPDNQWTSPQDLTGEVRQRACQQGASLEAIRSGVSHLGQLKNSLAYQALFERLPDEPLPEVAPAAAKGGAPRQAGAGGAPSTFLQSNVDIEVLQQQVDAGQAADPGPQAAQPQAAYQSGRLQRTRSRVGNELNARNVALQMYTQQEMAQQRLNYPALASGSVREGVSQPVWIGSQLLLARRVETDDGVLIQGCWLDWPKIKQTLTAEVKDLLPDVELEPVSNPAQIKVSRMLASLPVQLVVPAPQAQPARWSPMRISLLAAWGCLATAAVAAGVLLHGVLLLSERRGAFVSAVTHELRTPLTTFRMYSEMLAQNMVPEAGQRQAYLETLRLEADRLSHLVENVLAYARLERGRHRRPRERVSIATLLDRVHERLAERAAHAEMELVVEGDAASRARALHTDPAAVEQILFNLIDNACKYAATAEDRRIHLQVSVRGGEAQLRVRDHGAGIAAGDARRLFRPFSKSADQAAATAPGVGLGLALCQRLARELDGRLVLEPTDGDGAMFVLTLPLAG